MVYRRFTEKSAEEWRQIYKALQLLEFLIKHGSERVIDDARSHLTLLKMLRQFHFIDQNGKDQGINVRNRAKELAELLGDVDRIRSERKKARANKAKYIGVEGGAGAGFSGSSSRFGGFGNQSGGFGGDYGGYSGGVYGDGGGFGGQSSDFHDAQSRADRFEEYDEFDEAERPAPARSPPRATRSNNRASVRKAAEAPAEMPRKKEPEVDLFSFDELPSTSTAAAPIKPSVAAAPSGSGLASLGDAGEDDDFDDFQSATPATQNATNPVAPLTSTASGAQFAAPQPVSAPKAADLGSMVGLSSISPSSSTAPTANYSAFNTPLTATSTANSLTQAPKPTGYQASTPNYFQSVQVGPQQQQQPATPSFGVAKPAGAPVAKPHGGGDAFGALWSQASSGMKKTSTPTSGPAMGQLAKEKSSAGIWGAPASSSTPKPMGSSQATGNSSASGSLADLL